jgi:2-polyprenyl-6-methoxyphenol hydroxylase-like FAD-dependent oxidoreductase
VDERGNRHGPFEIVIAADGSRSTMREACGLRGRVIVYDYGALWAVADIAPLRGMLFQAARGTEQLGGLLPVGGGRCSLFWGLRRDGVEALMRRGFSRWRAQVLALMPQAEPVVDRIGTLEAMRYVTYRHVRFARTWRGRVVFLGDAAHAMSPHLGQGVNLALQDARALAAALDESRTPEQAFARYDRERRRPTRFYGGVTAMLTPFFQSHGVVLGWARDVALPLMCRFGPTRRAMLRTLCGIGLNDQP